MSEEIKELPERVQALSEKLGELATVEDNVIDYDDDAFKKTLPEKFKYKDCVEYEKHKVDFSAAMHHRSGTIGNELFAKNSDYDSVHTTKTKMVYDTLGLRQDRHRSGVTKLRGEEETWEHWGAITAIFESRVKKKVSMVGLASDHIMREAKKDFGK